MKKLIAAAQQLLAKTRDLTPEILNVVNEVRLAAHATGDLLASHEQTFQDLIARFGGMIVHTQKLVPLPSPITTDPMLGYDAGFKVGQARGTLPAGSSAEAQAGYAAGLSAPNGGTAGTSPNPLPPETNAPAPATATNPPAPEPPAKSVES